MSQSSQTAVTYRTRWAEMDPNGHMRHSAYTDFAADARITFLAAAGFDLRRFAELRLGPILFREETRFLKELHLGEEIKVDARLAQLNADGSRWSIVHGIYKEDGRLAATVTVDGAWLDLDRRKLTVPPAELTEMMRGLEPYVAPEGK
ncbi:thioesterase family protein [Hymenobacter sp. ASUV-10]|uniref:Thioesterase family protein n=1 Tax=Hymenobacter aranciens TaxID=3063996 RepID=A0ABT9BCE2_9BACT|nr:thioesterase family protein [Hymenobacter sp. ASUV-10]MDO7875913.1 thioesterase family protein [Hymenobacter sp. ASUV-10]